MSATHTSGLDPTDLESGNTIWEGVQMVRAPNDHPDVHERVDAAG